MQEVNIWIHRNYGLEVEEQEWEVGTPRSQSKDSEESS